MQRKPGLLKAANENNWITATVNFSMAELWVNYLTVYNLQSNEECEEMYKYAE